MRAKSESATIFVSWVNKENNHGGKTTQITPEKRHASQGWGCSGEHTQRADERLPGGHSVFWVVESNIGKVVRIPWAPWQLHTQTGPDLSRHHCARLWRHCSSHWPRRQRWASMDECRCLLLQQRLPTCRLVLAGLGGPGRCSRSCYILALGWIQSFEVKEGGRKGDVVYQARQCSRTYFI